MNPKVEEFINKMKEKQEKEKQEYLISLGLIDETKSINTIDFFDEWDGTKECQWDYNAQKYCKKVQKFEALDVTDEEYQEILKYAPISQTQISNKSKSNKKQVFQTKWANILYKLVLILSIIILIAGIVVSVIVESFFPMFYVILYVVLYIPFVIGFARIVEAAEKYIEEK